MRISFFEDLSVGRKITLGFGLTGFLFLIVVWQYHEILYQTLAGNSHLQSVHGAKKHHSLNIHRYMLASRRSEKDFLVRKKPEYVERVKQYVELVQAEAVALEKIEGTEESTKVALHIQELMQTYHSAFQEIVQAWHRKGLNHDSGLQGRFRDTIHEVEEKAKGFKTSSLYLILLQIRRAEKDLGLRFNKEYIAQVMGLVKLFHEQVQESSLDSQTRSTLSESMDSYVLHFGIYAKQVMEGIAIKGGTGPFRDIAHKLEAYLQKRYVPNLEQDILTLRRWEKDYLLRHDEKYVERVQSAAKTIQDNIESSQISSENKNVLIGFIDRYDKDFLALVEENHRIITLTAKMRDAVHKIEPLVEANVQSAITTMERETEEIQATSTNGSFLALTISLLAFMTAIFFAVVITRRITFPLYTLMRLAEIHTDNEEICKNLGHKNEVRALAAAMGSMDGTLARTFIGLSKQSEYLGQCAEKLTQISNEMTTATEMETVRNNVKNQAKEVAAAVTEIDEILRPRLES